MMTIYITEDKKLHDDDNGRAFDLLPKNSRIATQEEIDSILNPEESNEKIITRLESSIENHIQSVIKAMGYVSLERLDIYKNSTNAKWKAEALAAPFWVTDIWEKAIEVQSEVQSGLREVPTEAELLALMPKLEDYIQYE